MGIFGLMQLRFSDSCVAHCTSKAPHFCCLCRLQVTRVGCRAPLTALRGAAFLRLRKNCLKCHEPRRAKPFFGLPTGNMHTLCYRCSYTPTNMYIYIYIHTHIMYVYTCKYMWWCPMCVMFNPRYDPNRQEYFSGVAQLPASFCLPRTFSLCVVFSPQVYNIMIYNV